LNETYLHEYLGVAGLANEPKALLFQTYSRATGQLTGNPLLRTCPPRQGYGWENYTVSHERLLNHNIAARIMPRFARHGIPLFHTRA
jgi:hypothetical protein